MVNTFHAQHKTIESVLQRGEKLDTLVDRSNQLSMQSKAFYKTAKKVCTLVWSCLPLPLCPVPFLLAAILTHRISTAKLVLRYHVEPLVAELYTRISFCLLAVLDLPSCITTLHYIMLGTLSSAVSL